MVSTDKIKFIKIKSSRCKLLMELMSRELAFLIVTQIMALAEFLRWFCLQKLRLFLARQSNQQA